MTKTKLFLFIVVMAFSFNLMSQDNPVRVPIAPYNTVITPQILMPPADTVNGVWSLLVNLPTAVYGPYSYYWPDSNGVFVGGGTDGSNFLTTFYLYKLSSNTYIPKAPTPTGRALDKIVRVKNKLYLTSMVNNFTSPDGATYEYDPL